MTIAETLLPELEQESATTRALLAIVPDARFTWRPHAKSWTIGELATHIANLPSWVALTLSTSELDVDPPSGPAWTPPKAGNARELVAMFDANVAAAKAAIAKTSDAQMREGWALKRRGTPLFSSGSLPKSFVLRGFVMNHLIHHRGQLTVYLRMCDVPLPRTYGPTADTPF